MDTKTENWWDVLLDRAYEESWDQAKKLYNKAFRLSVGIKKRYAERDFKTLVDALLAAETLGHPIARYRLGVMCEERNYERALCYYSNSIFEMKRWAEHGDAEAALCMAEMYHFGRGFKENETLAQEWLDRSIAMGNRDAKAEKESWREQRETGRYLDVWLEILKIAEKEQ